MHRGPFRSGVVLVFLAVLAGSVAGGSVAPARPAGAAAFAASAQVETAMNFDPAIECWYHDEFPQLDAGFDPGGPFAQRRLYFKCTRYPDYYFVDLSTEGGVHRAVAPMAEDDCPSVEWYVEVVRPDFSSSRSVTRTAPVTSYAECRRRNPAVAFFDGDPGLVVGTTTSALELLGFKPVGVASFMTAAGEIVAAGGGGGGLSGAAIAGIAAGGAGAAALGATLGGGSDGNGDGPSPDPPAPPPSPPSGPSSPPPAPPTSPVTACIETRPAMPTIEAGESISFDARCSTGDNLQFLWEVLEDGREKTGNFVSFLFSTPGIFTVQLTVTQPATPLRSLRDGLGADELVDTATVTVTVKEPPLVACFTATNTDPGGACVLQFDASCSEGPITSYDWILDKGNAYGFGPVPKSGQVVTHDFTKSPFGVCGRATAPPPMDVELTVSSADGRSETVVSTVTVVFLKNPLLGRQTVDASFTSYLGVAPFDGGVAGQVRHNEQQVDVVNNTSPAQHRIRGRYGENELEAYTTTPTDEPGYWRFDFTGAASFVAGSLKPIAGQVLSVGDRAIVFRVNGQPGERIRFRYQLLP